MSRITIGRILNHFTPSLDKLYCTARGRWKYCRKLKCLCNIRNFVWVHILKRKHNLSFKLINLSFPPDGYTETSNCKISVLGSLLHPQFFLFLLPLLLVQTKSSWPQKVTRVFWIFSSTPLVHETDQLIAECWLKMSWGGCLKLVTRRYYSPVIKIFCSCLLLGFSVRKPRF